MKVTIDRNICTAALNACEHCFSFFADHPMGVDRYCIVEQIDDGSDCHEQTLTLDEAQRQLVASEGWSSFVDFIPKYYRA